MKGLIITPTLGNSAWIDAVVGCVQQYAPQALHILVTPVDVVNQLNRRFERVTVLGERGEGMYAAINHAARAVPDWVWMTYLNDDDVLQPGFERLVENASAVGADISYGQVSYVDSNDNSLGVFPVESRTRRFASLMAAGIPPFTQQGTLIRRECFERLGGFNTDFRLAADFDFWVRAVVSGASFRHVPVEVASFRLRAGQLSADQTGVQAELASIIADHFPRQSRWTRLLVRTAFRLRHVPAILARRWKTGSWRTGDSTWRPLE